MDVVQLLQVLAPFSPQLIYREGRVVAIELKLSINVAEVPGVTEAPMVVDGKYAKAG